MGRTKLWLGALMALALAATGCGDDGGGEDGGPPDGAPGDGGMRGTPGITVAPTEGLTTTEGGEEATFTVVLDAQPTDDVTVGIESDDPSEGNASPSTLTFTPANWNAPQTVTVTGVDDDVADGNVTYSVTTGPAASTDPGYDGLDADDVVLTNTDDETAGITVEPTAGLETTEMGGTDELTIVLNAAPTADVVIALSSDDDTEGTVSPSEVTFTIENWDAPQTVTVTGVDDDAIDGNTEYTVVTEPATSDDEAYNGIDAEDVSVTNIDDETAGVTVEPTAGLTTTEGMGTDTFTIVLNAAPTADVTIPLMSDNDGEGTVSPGELTFTPENWDAPQTVTVTGVDDDLPDGNQPYNVVVGAAMSDDANYAGIDGDDVSVTNTDDDSAGFTVDPTEGLTTTEAGGTDTFTVVLNAEPTADVTIALSSNEPDEGTVSPETLVFTPENWSAPATVTVTGVDDDRADGNQTYSIVTDEAMSDDVNYAGLDPVNVAVTNTDDDTAGVTVAPTEGLTTTEDGDADTFTVVLNAEPTADVTIGLSSDDTSEGTVSPDMLVFTAENWDAPQTVTATGVDDASEDGSQTYMIVTANATSDDASYDGLTVPDVSVSNTDNDSAGVRVTPTSGLVTDEDLGEDTFEVVLNSRPTADVTFMLSSTDPSEGTPSRTELVFTPDNWDAPQPVTVAGVDDASADGDVPYTIQISPATSDDGNYMGIDPTDVSVTNNDNDSAGIRVTPTMGLRTTEAGGTATFEVVLSSRPTADVTLGLMSSEPSEGTVDRSMLTFTPDNWNAPQAVTVTGEPDATFDGDQPYTIVTEMATSADTAYDGLDPADVSVINEDNDPGVRVSPTSGLETTEAGGTVSFTVVLNTPPSEDVELSVASDDTSEGTATPSMLTFTPANWDAPQTVTVVGQDDDVADGDQVFMVEVSDTVSTDSSYNGLPADDVEVTNTDDETAGIRVIGNELTTTEEGGTDDLEIVLRSQPTADVVIPLESSDTSEGTLDRASLTFTAANWDAPQTVRITGQDDDVADGDQPYTIRTLEAMSGDTGYAGLNARNVDVTNVDDETAGITVRPLSVVTNEGGGLMPTFEVRLNSEPTDNVTIPVSSADTSEATASPGSLEFTPANWDSFQAVTITGREDAVADGDQTYAVVVGPASSSDSTYDGLEAPDVSGMNVDNDSAGITVAPTSGLTTTEEGDTATFTIELNSQPTSDVVIDLSSSDASEGSVSPASLTFTSMNWDAPQDVVVSGLDDDVADGNQDYLVRTAPASSGDGAYDLLDAADVEVTNTDDETAGFTVIPVVDLMVTENGGTDTFEVRLNSEPTAPVTITLMSDDTGEGTVNPSSFTFTADNWDAPQEATVTGQDDPDADGNATFNIITGVASSADMTYDGLNPEDVVVTNVDDETPGVTILSMPPLQTTEEGGTATFSLVLDSRPTADVTIGLASGDPSEGTVSPTSVTFTPTDWNAPQELTVTGADDDVADGNQDYTILTAAAMSMDGDYDMLDAADVTVSNIDDETAGILVEPRDGLVTNEQGRDATFTVRLTSEPTAAVDIPLASDDMSEGTVSPTMLSFDAGNWDMEQTVTVTGGNDDVADGNQAYAIVLDPASSMDLNYDMLSGGEVQLTNLDDETAGISVTPTAGLITDEGGGTDRFEVVLNSQPTADVVIELTGQPDEGTLSTTTLTFDDMNWNTAQEVTITGADDTLDDGNQRYFVIGDPSTSMDPDYAALSNFNVEVTNVDND